MIIAGLIMLQQAVHSQVKWLTIEQAMDLNKKKPKPFFIDLYTDWCGWCKSMDATTFAHPVIAEMLNTNFHPVKFNAESAKTLVFNGNTFVSEGRTHQFAIALLQGQLSYPSFAFLDAKQQLLTSVPGYRTAPQMEPVLAYISSGAYLKQNFETFSASYKSKIQ